MSRKQDWIQNPRSEHYRHLPPMKFCDNPSCTSHCEIITVDGNLHWKNGFGGEVPHMKKRTIVGEFAFCEKCLGVFELVNSKVKFLEDAIRKHRDATGHDMCWENDEELWSVLKDGVKLDHTPPTWCEFMKNCAAYRASKDK